MPSSVRSKETEAKTSLQGTSYEHVFSQLFQQLGPPAEFELPGWVMKQKTVSYTFIKRNVYLTKKTKLRVNYDGIFCSCSTSPESPTACGNDCLCGALLSSCSENCKCRGMCHNSAFQHRPMKKMKLVQTKRCGSGIIANENIRQGDFIIEYVGEVIDDKTCEERLWRMKHLGETNFYLCEINRDTVIDATFKGNKSRYINHSCQPNTEMQKWIINGETRIGIFAVQDIKKGEELTYDYQFVQFGADQECHCGARGCRGKLGSKPSKSKPSTSEAAAQLIQLGAFICTKSDGLMTKKESELVAGNSHMSAYHAAKRVVSCINSVIRVWCPTTRMYYGGVILSFDSQSKRHTILTEDGELKTLDLSAEDWAFLGI